MKEKILTVFIPIAKTKTNSKTKNQIKTRYAEWLEILITKTAFLLKHIPYLFFKFFVLTLAEVNFEL